MTQTAIPYIFMRGGTSRGPYFRRSDLPEDLETLADVLAAALGAGQAINIDGIGGGTAVTTKVAMLSVSEDDWADIDYFFAQVSVEEKLVDFKPTCGNILSGVAPAAIEMGLFKPQGDETEIRIRAVNTGARVIARVQTPGGELAYEGDAEIAGVPGQSAPVQLSFMGVVGSATGAFLPTGNLRETVQGIDLTCMDVAMPMVIAQATEFGLTGYESAEELDANRDFFDRMEAVRIEAGKLMGMGDVSKSVTPKFGLFAPAKEGGTIAVRYFMPWKTHPTMAVTGAQCMASCALTPGTVADGLLDRPDASPAEVILEHASGKIDVLVEFSHNGGFNVNSAGLVRTARKLADGHVYVPESVWNGS
ncbi:MULTISPECIES: 4-oxalomesaconate tautomerase [unclassified Ruegeria]|uniref:4-oxalomesaconate tautomerase n=1 Tax=unclassified Ruegeria TaxID=2625375 RepID=UPI0014894649|nr:MULTISPECIES: 4-oxalomesaconate tautomerase [unclassified Ruegeria]NOD89045.1 4-oxalomesaconate tautomerase [Ruegeria sp. HKCCD4318]NOD93222.1 4-oxalomesaconate tautomerase [Ruegeria sp. HKCCD4884]NOE14369.1 4-oxalomesaconate tautomerase [Ruegeria sp. HKCCD4318-2]NOG10109.1 4-oxalomesaconate tautomerase [Ruegeria sp. HKCCD4315]